jgi:biopolymer transport protein ExbD
MAAKLSGAGAGRFRIDQNAEINVTPFVDVMLVLLIIFMVAAPLATVSIAVDLPPADSGAPPKAEPTFISIQKSGDLFIADHPTSLTALAADLPAEMARKGVSGAYQAQRVYVRADGAVPYERFMAVMNTLQDNGYDKVGLVAEDIR